MTKQTQGRRLIAHLKRRAMTSMQIQMLGISTCWWKRVNESLRDGEVLISGYVNGEKFKRHTITGEQK